MKGFKDSFPYKWFEERIPLKELVEFISKKGVPLHGKSYWYFFGGICLFLYITQVISGILLLLYYKPTVESAYESVHFIVARVNFGWLIRSIHSWSANLLIGAIFIHMFSTLFFKAYRKPRELTWVTGAVLLFLFLSFGFSGYLLPWNELSFFATKVGTEIVGALPLIGKPLKIFLRGGEEVSGATLTRFFGLHIAVLPGITFIILGIHLLLIQIHGISVPIGMNEKNIKSEPFFPDFALKDLMVWLGIVIVLLFLSVFFPWPLGDKADPFASAPAGIKPEWYFTFMFFTLKLIPQKVIFIEGEVLGVLLFFLSGLLWIFIPFFDKKASRGEKGKFFTWLGILAVIYIITMTILAYIIPGK
ncbi:MAG: cytochrome b [Candidatus Aminicenantia bacterium]